MQSHNFKLEGTGGQPRTMTSNETTTPTDPPPPSILIRNKLNDYESMLVRGTCNVGLSMTVPEDMTIESLHLAWKRCVGRYDLLRVKFQNTNEMGVLGPRYQASLRLDEYALNDSNSNNPLLFQVKEQAPPQIIESGGDSSSSSTTKSLLQRLQRVGCTLMDPGQGSYAVEGNLWRPNTATDGSSKEQHLELILSLSHAVSDGPGALQLAHAFLVDLQAVVDDGSMGTTEDDDTAGTAPTISQPLIDLQAKILGADYGATSRKRQDEVYNGNIQAYREGLKNKASSPRLLPPEALQGIPSDPSSSSSSGGGCVDAVYIFLSQWETKQLRDACRSAGATIQGAISAASLVTRIQILGMEQGDDDEDDSIQCVVQVPMNARKLAARGGDTGIDNLTCACLCGSAGVLHAIEIPRRRKSLLTLAKECTERMRHAMEARQPVEWLYRLMNDPSSLPPYSLMASSVGVAPIQTDYGSSIKVSDCLFFGASLDTSPKAQGTMIHAVTFDGKLQIAMNFASPGIQRAFMEESSDIFKSTLLAMIEETAKA
jgi:hypothetical protein